MCVHFVGFRGDEFTRARRVWGNAAHMVHFSWDARAAADVGEDDVVVFAREKDVDRFNGTRALAPCRDDSAFF